MHAIRLSQNAFAMYVSLATTIFTACHYGYHRFNMTVLHSCQWILVCCLRMCSKPTNGKNSSTIVSLGRFIRTFESICFEYVSTFDTNVTMVSVVVFFRNKRYRVIIESFAAHDCLYRFEIWRHFSRSGIWFVMKFLKIGILWLSV